MKNVLKTILTGLILTAILITASHAGLAGQISYLEDDPNEPQAEIVLLSDEPNEPEAQPEFIFLEEEPNDIQGSE